MGKRSNILITGSSSGIGKAISLSYSDSGSRLFLLGRSTIKLEEVAKICRVRGAEVHIFSVDVTNRILMESLLKNICEQYILDTVIVSAGVSANSLGSNITQEEKIYQIFDINFIGMLNTILPIIPFMVKNKNGNIAVISSLAGLIGLTNSPEYSTSKMAVNCFINSIRPYLKLHKVNASIILPGYVDTPMTKANNFFMPLKITPEKAAEIIKKGISKHKRIIVFPYSLYITLKIINILPLIIVDYLNNKLMRIK